MRLPYLILILAYATGCAHVPTVKAPAGTDSARDGKLLTRAEVLQIAQAYAQHQWHGTSTNIYHGLDAKGVRVDTPDAEWWGRGGWYADGRLSTGLPYCWNGDSTLAEFDAGISNGLPAGCMFKNLDRKHDPPDSDLPVGVDCSGFVGRCWHLKVRKSTYDMSDVTYQLPTLDALRPGDAVNRPHGHIILFIAWTDDKHDKMFVYEEGDARRSHELINHNWVHIDTYDRTWLEAHGFVPLRYRNIED